MDSRFIYRYQLEVLTLIKYVVEADVSLIVSIKNKSC